jgi:hypothetical protein
MNYNLATMNIKSINPRKNQLRSWLNRVFIAGLIFFIIWLLVYAWNVIVTYGPTGYREGANMLLTEYILKGRNPFVLMNQPLMNTNKGAFYNLLVVPFAAIFGNTLALHRIISIVFILLSCGLVVWCLWRLRVNKSVAIAGGMICFAGLLFYVGPTARSDGLGTFLYLVSGLIPFMRKFDRQSLLISAAAGILAFFTKPYFILSFGIVALYIFLFISKKKALFYFIGTSLFLLAAALLVRRFFACYFLNTILNNATNKANHIDFLFKQLAVFAGIFSPLFLIFVLNNPIRLDKPFLSSAFDYFGFFFLSATGAILVLGQNTGNYMVYLFQLMTPPLVILALKNQKPKLNLRPLLTLPLLLINLYLLSFHILYPNTPPPAEQWQEINRLLSQSKKVLNSPVLVPEMIRLGLQPIDSGSTEYYYQTRPYEGNLIAPLYSATKMRGEDYLYEIENNIRTKGFDKIIITKGYSPFAKLELLQQYYFHVKDFHIEIPQSRESWDLEYWEPIR